MDGFPQMSSLVFKLFKLIIEINKCITKSPKMGIIPLVIGIPGSAMGIVAKSAIIMEIASSKGCNWPISRFPIKRITTKTIMYKKMVLKNVNNIFFAPLLLF